MYTYVYIRSAVDTIEMRLIRQRHRLPKKTNIYIYIYTHMCIYIYIYIDESNMSFWRSQVPGLTWADRFSP